MNKIRILLVVISMGLFLSGNAGYAFTFHDGDGSTYEANYMGNYVGNDYYSLIVDGGDGQGLLFFDSSWSSFKVTVFENDIFWGYSVDGYWEGDGSTGYGANTAGRLYETQIFMGTSSLSHDVADSNRK